MQLVATRSGGIAGVREELGPVDTDSIDSGLAERIQTSLDEVGFFDLPEEISSDRRIADGFSYSLKATGEREHRVRWSDGAEHPALQGLRNVRQLMEETGATWQDAPLQATPTDPPQES